MMGFVLLTFSSVGTRIGPDGMGSMYERSGGEFFFNFLYRRYKVSRGREGLDKAQTVFPTCIRVRDSESPVGIHFGLTSNLVSCLIPISLLTPQSHRMRCSPTA